MRETTLLEVMAEVSQCTNAAVANGADARSADDLVGEIVDDAEEALEASGDSRRRALIRAASFAILALHAHDAEAAKEIQNDDHG